MSLSGAINYLDASNANAPARVIHGHQSPITAMVLDRPRKRLFTSSMTGEICQWDLETGVGSWLRGQAPEVTVSALTLSTDGETLTSFSYDNQARVHSVSSGQFGQSTVDLGGQPAGAVSSRTDSTITFAILRNDKLVAVQGGSRVVSTESLPSEPTAIAIGPDDRVYVGLKNKAIMSFGFDGSKFTAGAKISGHDKPVTSITFSVDGQWMIATDRVRFFSFECAHCSPLSSSGELCFRS